MLRPTPRHPLSALKGFLAPNADVIFFSCITGRGSPGDGFLKTLSSKLPGRRIIAFTTIVWYSPYPNTASQVKDSGVHQRILAPRKESSYTGKPNIGPSSANAKWAKDGRIRRLARDDERLGKPKPTPKGDPIWMNKELWEPRCNPGPFMSLKRKLEKQGKYYYETREDLEGCKN